MSNPQPIDAVRKRLAQDLPGLVVQALLGSVYLLLNLAMGVGKTFAICRYIAAGLWREHFDVIVVAVASHANANEYVNQLRKFDVEGVVRFPSVDDALCAGDKELFKQLKNHKNLRLWAVFSSDFCQQCPHKQGCPYRSRHEPSQYRDCQILLLPEQLLSALPTFLQDIFPNKRILMVFDEARCAAGGFVKKIDEEAISNLAEVARDSLGSAFAEDLLALRSPWGDMAPEDRQRCRITLSRAWLDSRFCDETFHLRDIEQCIDHLLWREGGELAYRARPNLPPSGIILGAHLDPRLIAYNFDHLSPPLVPFDGISVSNPDTLTIQVHSRSFAKRSVSNNRASTAALIVDIAAANQGSPIAVLTSKDSDRGVPYATALRKEIIRKLEEHPDRPQREVVFLHNCTGRDREIVLITYGAIGSNAAERCVALVTANAYYVSPLALRDTAYAHLAPSQRPKVSIDRDRRVDVAGRSSREVAYVQAVLFQIETDVVLQAAGRVRPHTHPRTLIVAYRGDLRGYLGKPIQAETLRQVHHFLNLEPAKERRNQRAQELAREGLTAEEIGRQLDRSASWVRGCIRSAPEVSLRLGRPPKAPHTPSLESPGGEGDQIP